jgi:hypothetical protein
MESNFIRNDRKPKGGLRLTRGHVGYTCGLRQRVNHKVTFFKRDEVWLSQRAAEQGAERRWGSGERMMRRHAQK